MSAAQSPKDLARELAQRARRLRLLVLDELKRERGLPEGHDRPVLELHEAFNKALARQTEEEFSDAYAQTLTYGLLAARWMARAAERQFTAETVAELLPSTSSFLADLFQRLISLRTSPNLREQIEDVIGLLDRTAISEVFEGEPRDPVIHFYEPFLDAYDPLLRRDRGVYYTPDEVVSYIVRTAHEALQARFGLALGLADTTTWAQFAEARGEPVPEGVSPEEPFVQILDPAAGTGTFLLRVIEVVHETMMASYAARELEAAAAQKEWTAYVRAHLLPRINGFELMMAPYIVSHLRLGLALQQTGFVFEGGDRLRVFLTNTLEMHSASQLDLIGERVAEEAREAERAKSGAPISVVLGNPPYEREREPSDAGASHKGGQVRDGWSGWRRCRPLLADYTEPASATGAGGHLKNIYNLYVYFWRWATWRVFDRFGAPGIVSFITASSYLRGPGFVGVREEMRRAADDIYVLDLEGDQRGARVTENVFGITIPVCVNTLIRPAAANRGVAGRAHYSRLTGSRGEKLAACGEWRRLGDVPWVNGDAAWRAPLVAAARTDYGAWPSLLAIFPWQQSGCKAGRTWVVGETEDVLEARWMKLIDSPRSLRARLFKNSPTGQKADHAPIRLPPADGHDTAIASLTKGAPAPGVERFGYRSFDRRWVLADSRMLDRAGPPSWYVRGSRQVYMTSLLSGVIGLGPAATISAYVPDLHHFRGSYGGKDVVPLWRDPAGLDPNITAGVMETLELAYGVRPAPEDVLAYTYSVLAHPGYVARFEDELQIPGPRIPITKSKPVFERGAALGRDLIRWHTFGERFRTKGDGFELAGSADVRRPISAAASDYPDHHSYDESTRALKVGGGEIGHVEPAVWSFCVSGLPIVKSWLDHRMKKGAGKRSSALDDIRPSRWTDDLTRELLELLWILEWTLHQYPAHGAWLDEVLSGDLFTAAELPLPTEAERKEPKVERARQGSSPG